VDGLMTFCHDARKGRYIGSHWPNHVRASALLDQSLLWAGGVKVLEVRINGVAGRFILDTGASYTAVFRDAAERFKRAATQRVIESSTANEIIQAPVSYGQLEVGRQKLDRAAVLLLPRRKEQRPTDGLLGMNFLDNYDWQTPQWENRLILRGYSNKQ